MIRVLVADNSQIHTRLLAEALTRDELFRVTPFEPDSSGIVASIADHNIDVLVVSSTLDEQPCRGLEVVRELRTAHPLTRAVILPDSSKDDLILQSFRAGARGVFGRNEPVELLSKCVQCVYDGQVWAKTRDLEIVLAALVNIPTLRAVNAAGISLLSERELEVVRYIAEGLTNREIAERMKLSQHTIKNYLFRVFDKLGVSSRTELLSMTMSPSAVDHAGAPKPSKKMNGAGEQYSQHEYGLIKKSAEAGLPAAQLALAQIYLTRHSGTQDLIEAYKWFLIATERLLPAREFVKKNMTAQQIHEAQSRAKLWLSNRRQTETDSVGQAKRPSGGDAATDLSLDFNQQFPA